jgi:hypothetical protein
MTDEPGALRKYCVHAALGRETAKRSKTPRGEIIIQTVAPQWQRRRSFRGLFARREGSAAVSAERTLVF